VNEGAKTKEVANNKERDVKRGGSSAPQSLEGKLGGGPQGRVKKEEGNPKKKRDQNGRKKLFKSHDITKKGENYFGTE